MVGSRTPKPAQLKAGSRTGRAQASAAALRWGQPAGSRTRWARSPPAPSRGRTTPAPPALLAPGQHHSPSAPTGKLRSDRIACWGPRGFPQRFLPEPTWAGSLASVAAPLSDGARDTSREGQALGPSGWGRRGRGTEVEGSSPRWGGRQSLPAHPRPKLAEKHLARGCCGDSGQGTPKRLPSDTGLLLAWGQITKN